MTSHQLRNSSIRSPVVIKVNTHTRARARADTDTMPHASLSLNMPVKKWSLHLILLAIARSRVGRAMAQAVSRWPLTAEARVRARVNPCGICGGESGTGQVFSEYFGFPCKDIIPPLLHIHLSPPHEVCDCSDQAAHYHNLGPQLGASLLTRYIGWKHKKKERKKSWIININ
jgi:hypothetical protein